MKTIPLYVLTAILLVGWTISTLAQDMYRDDEYRQRMQAEFQARMQARQVAMRAAQRSPAMQQMQRNSVRQVMNSFWEGDDSMHMAMGFLQHEDFREGVGVSEEQWQNIMLMLAPGNLMEGPEFQQYRDEMNELMQDGGPFGENASEEMLYRFAELQSQRQTKIQEVMMEKMADAVSENLTPEQIQKIKEAQISAMDAFPIISPSMFEALDLSDAQKRQLDAIKKEMAPEFEKHVDKLVDVQMKVMEAMQERSERLMSVTDPEERARLSEGFSPENIIRNNPALQRAVNEMMESGKVFSDRLKFRMFDVLTDAQWARLVNLIDHPPEYMKKVIAEMRKQMGADNPQATSRQPGSGWTPGPGAWQPGDAIPEGYRIQRETRRQFPRGE